MLLGMKRRFEPFVLDGSKRHTIRAKRKLRPRVGEICHVYVNPRQKSMRLLGRWRCTRVEDIRIQIEFSFLRAGAQCNPWIPHSISAWINGDVLTMAEINRLCWQDGFRSGVEETAWR